MMHGGWSTGHCIDDKTVITQCMCTCVSTLSLDYSEALFSRLNLVFSCAPQGSPNMQEPRKNRALTRTSGNFPVRRVYQWRARQVRAPQSSKTEVKKMLRLVLVKSADPEKCVCGM